MGIQKGHLQNACRTCPGRLSTYTMAALTQLVQSRIDAANAVANAKANWQEAAATYDALNTKVTEVVRALRQYVINVFGPESPQLADFGFAPPKKTALTPEQKVVKAAKAKATREARGTTSKKQKQAVTGNVTGVVVTPVTAPAPLLAATPGPAVVTTPAPAVTAAPAVVPAAAPANAQPRP